MKRYRLKEAFTRTSADVLKSSFANLLKRGIPQDKFNLSDSVTAQPAYRSMKYEDRSEIDDFIDSLPDGPLSSMAFNNAVDKALGSATVSSAVQPSQQGRKLSSTSEIEEMIANLAKTNPEFSKFDITSGMVGGMYSPQSISSLSHGMGPQIRTVFAGEPEFKSVATSKTVGQTYNKRMDPKNIHSKRSFSNINVPTGGRRYFNVTPQMVKETSMLYDVYADELVPQSVFERRNVVYGALIRQGILPPPIEMQNLRRTRVRSESLISKFVSDILFEMLSSR